MKILFVASKYLREMAREVQLLALILLLPLFFVVISALGYSALPMLKTYPILVMDPNHIAESYIHALKSQRYADGRAVFFISGVLNRHEAEEALKEKYFSALVIFLDEGGSKLTINIHGDATSMAFLRASAQVDKTLRSYIEGKMGKPLFLVLKTEPVSVHAPLTEFDVYAPGMIIFGLLLLIPQTAMLVGRELRVGTLRRLSLTCIKPVELLLGLTISQMVVAIFQIGVLFLALIGFGLHYNGSLLLAMGVGSLVCLSAVGMGLIVACFVENDSEALNTGSTVSMVLVFLSGAFFAMPAPTLFNLSGHVFTLIDVFPASDGMLILQQILTGGAGLSQVRFRLIWMIGMTILTMGAGIVLFKYKDISR